MSSWNNGRPHFRERKPRIIPQPPIIDTPSQPIPTNNIDTYPSKYVLNTNNSNNDAVVCAIALNEEPYIDEWINYNLALGFSHIYIYDNSNDNSLKNKKTDKVSIISFPGKLRQLEAYDIFKIQYRNKYKWCAFIDCDEFIVLKKHNDILSFLDEYSDCESIALNWIMFGTSNEKEYRADFVTRRFRYCSNIVNLQIKCICQLNHIYKYTSPHKPQLLSGHVYDTNRKIVDTVFNPDGDSKIACIHHYYTKSEQEFRDKIERGKADIPGKRGLDELINIHSQNNDIYNSDAWDFYSKHFPTM